MKSACNDPHVSVESIFTGATRSAGAMPIALLAVAMVPWLSLAPVR